jgi:hypothetical protein
MEDVRTQTITFDSSKPNISPVRETNFFNVKLDEPVVENPASVNIGSEVKVKKEKQSKHFSALNPHYSYFPTFFKKELHYSFVSCVL